MLRVVETEQGRESLIKLIESTKLPMTVTVIRGRGRSLAQNKLQRLWLKEASEQLDEYTAEQYRGYCKLVFGVPIMRAESEEFCEVYDRLIMPRGYEEKIELMMVPMDLPVTRIMTTRQKKQYLDEMYHHFTALGCLLTDPDMLGLKI